MTNINVLKAIRDEMTKVPEGRRAEAWFARASDWLDTVRLVRIGNPELLLYPRLFPLDAIPMLVTPLRGPKVRPQREPEREAQEAFELLGQWLNTTITDAELS